MKRIVPFLFVAILLFAVRENCFALIRLEGITRERAEKELGVVMKREFLGLGSVTNEAGISIEFAPKGNLEGFLSVKLDVYLDPPPEEGGLVKYRRRLTSVTLLPVIQTKEKVRVFISVDPQYLNRTEVWILVRHTDPTGPDGYKIRLDPKDFPPPKANNAVEPIRAPTGARGSP